MIREYSTDILKQASERGDIQNLSCSGWPLKLTRHDKTCIKRAWRRDRFQSKEDVCANRAKVAATAPIPRCSQAHNLGHSKECLPAQHNFAAQHHFVAHHRNSVAQHNSMVQRNLVTQLKCFTRQNFEVKYNFNLKVYMGIL